MDRRRLKRSLFYSSSVEARDHMMVTLFGREEMFLPVASCQDQAKNKKKTNNKLPAVFPTSVRSPAETRSIRVGLGEGAAHDDGWRRESSNYD